MYNKLLKTNDFKKKCMFCKNAFRVFKKNTLQHNFFFRKCSLISAVALNIGALEEQTK